MNWIGRFFVAMRAAEERKGVVPAARRRDQFPVGMRVLAVDDDPVCLKVLETLLLRCQYHGKYFFFSFCSSVLVFFFVLEQQYQFLQVLLLDVYMYVLQNFA